MKKITFLIIALSLSFSLFAAKLIFIETSSFDQTRQLFSNSSLKVHYYSDHFAIATASDQFKGDFVLLDQDAFKSPDNFYYLMWLNKNDAEPYLSEINNIADILFQTREFAILSASASEAIRLYPAVHGGMVRITDREAKLPSATLPQSRALRSVNADIEAMMAQVSQDSLEATVQHLQDYGTRNAYEPESVSAQNWILAKFASYGLSTELHDFTMPGGSASDNVIATLTGTVYPDEYVVLGSHYDSYAYGGVAPGADDNASGTAGILEAARIMSQYTFDRSIIFATWSGEEYGLYGSEAWASEAAADGMNILGYFNMDMAGYLEPGGTVHTDIIAPSSANELRQFYKDVCAIYLPDFEIFDGALSGGDSDHTSFNQNGFMGIFPFEDSQNYSPYIHSSDDVIGLSVNNFEQHQTFTKAIIANVATMADRLPSPENLLAVAGDSEVSLSWSGVEGAEFYYIYRDDQTVPFDSTLTMDYLDNTVVNGTAYTYFVTAIFEDTGEESDPSNSVTVIPMPPIAMPFFDDYETGGPYWTFEETWGISEGTYYSATHSMTESPNGNYGPNMDVSATLRALDFTGAYSVQLSFWTRYRIESGYDYMYLEISTDGTNWDELDSFTGNLLNWGLKIYSLNEYIDEENVLIRFRFFSDVYVEDQGMFIDDIEIVMDGVGIIDPTADLESLDLKLQPNPSKSMTTASFELTENSKVNLKLIDGSGKIVKEVANGEMEAGLHTVEIDTRELNAGNYYLVLDKDGQRFTTKLIVVN